MSWKIELYFLRGYRVKIFYLNFYVVIQSSWGLVLYISLNVKKWCEVGLEYQNKRKLTGILNKIIHMTFAIMKQCLMKYMWHLSMHSKSNSVIKVELFCLSWYVAFKRYNICRSYVDIVLSKIFMLSVLSFNVLCMCFFTLFIGVNFTTYKFWP